MTNTQTARSPETTADSLAALSALLDEHVVGHAEVKRALLLGLLCREHVYLEGPPGIAKTRLAEIAAQGSQLDFFFYQLHRDTRLAELVGDVVLERQEMPDGGGERIHQRIQPGGILTAEVCVLDDISRAPGEALNVLLRILNERRFNEEPIPLMVAIATGNPMEDEYYNEPLDPANVDRFAIQLRVRGLIQSGNLEDARELIDRFASGDVVEQPTPEKVLDRESFDALYEQMYQVVVPEEVRVALLEILRALVVEQDCNESNSLLTDRSFLVKAIKLLRGHAMLAGRDQADLSDLDVLLWMTTFRVPEEAHEALPDLIARARK